MTFKQIEGKLTRLKGVERSTMMQTPCLRFQGNFFAMESPQLGGLIIKVSPQRVDELIAMGKGMEFNLTKKKFKEWVVIPQKFSHLYESYAREALNYAKQK